MKPVAWYAHIEAQTIKITLPLIKTFICCLMVSSITDCLKILPQFCHISTHRQTTWLQRDHLLA